MTTAIDRSGSRLEERGRPNLKREEQRTGGAAMYAASDAGRTAEGAADERASLADQQVDRSDPTTSDDGDEQRPEDDSIGQNLPPMPRPARRAMAAGRGRVGSLERLAPSAAAVMVGIAVAVVVTIALVVLVRSRRRSPAEEFMARLGRVPERIAAQSA